MAGTEHKEFEYQYSWGPKFDDSLKNIPLGVTRHDNENYNKLLSQILRTEFGWYIQDDKHTFECEEITDIPNLVIDNNEMYACRFVHSMVDNTTELPTHLDGAIRAYTDEKMIERLDISIKHCERNTDYTKLWRIDGVIPVETWQELITHYYRDNMMVGEYFNGKDENMNSARKHRQESAQHVVSLKTFVPCNINRGEGIKIFFSFSPIKQFSEEWDICIRPNSFLLYKRQKYQYIESETISLYKLLKRNGSNVRLPFSKRINYNDLVYNYPIFECKNIQDANKVIFAIKQLSEKWHKNKDDRLVSFTIKVPYTDKIGKFSFLGHFDDFLEYCANGYANIPEEGNILSWISSSYDFLKMHFNNNVNCIHPFEVINSNGNLSINRIWVASEKIKFHNKELITDLILSADEAEIIKKHGICAVAAFFDKSTTCSKCKKTTRNVIALVLSMTIYMKLLNQKNILVQHGLTGVLFCKSSMEGIRNSIIQLKK